MEASSSTPNPTANKSLCFTLIQADPNLFAWASERRQHSHPYSTPAARSQHAGERTSAAATTSFTIHIPGPLVSGSTDAPLLGTLRRAYAFHLLDLVEKKQKFPSAAHAAGPYWDRNSPLRWAYAFHLWPRALHGRRQTQLCARAEAHSEVVRDGAAGWVTRHEDLAEIHCLRDRSPLPWSTAGAWGEGPPPVEGSMGGGRGAGGDNAWRRSGVAHGKGVGRWCQPILRLGQARPRKTKGRSVLWKPG